MSSKKLNRRDFIRLSSLASASLPIALSGYPLFANEKPSNLSFDSDNDNVLVLVQLQGGNDGLNTIFDLNQYDNLQNVRSNIIIPENQLLSINADTALHPSMMGMQGVWEKEKLSIIQNVGYPNQNRSHFRSTDIWHTASDADEFIATGWLGRYFSLQNDQFPTGYPNDDHPHPFAITIGKIVSETCQGTNANFSMALTDPENPGTASVFDSSNLPNNCYGDALQFVNDIAKQTNAYASVITDAASQGNTLSTKYTDSDLSEKLKNVARLIAGGLQTKVYIVQLGGFDTHDSQVIDGNNSVGIHANLLQEFSDAIAAFQDDLELLNISNRVVGMTYSEFGRRIRSNGALGTDHGTAAPMFLFGDCVNNKILGDAPEIDTQVDQFEGVPMQFDFRDVYRTIITDWLGGTTTDANTVLFRNFNALDVFKAGCNASLSTHTFNTTELDLKVYPNPAANYLNIEFFGYDRNVKITLFNSLGAVMKTITNKEYSSTKHAIQIDISNLATGNYFIHYQSNGISKTKKLIKY
ncbi:MAG: hypothetical protein CMB99_03910 [Flavobacteriaceae bacterium]|nr:hypothetical protein [Flavobacteriaceae bacterium]|tara:strand:+ start:68096 stop:69670 length:1575 start_codon:yes stop_codon:yes gene_type:complete